MNPKKLLAGPKYLELIILPALLVIIYLLPHVFFYGNGYVDMEKNCVQAARDIANQGLFKANLRDYFTTIANPVFFVLLLAGAYRLFGESPVVSRLTVSGLTAVFLILLYFYLRKKEGAKTAFIGTLLISVNSMFIVYSQYVYSDVPFAVFLASALVLLIYSRSLKENIASSVLLGLSLSTKYIAAPLFFVAVFITGIKDELVRRFDKSRLLSFIRFNLWYFILALAVSLPLVMLVWRYQGSVLPDQDLSRFAFDITDYIPHFFAYLLWFGLFIGLAGVIIIYDFWKKAGTKTFLIVLAGLAAVTFIVSLFYPIASLHAHTREFGEMNLGWVESVVPDMVLTAAFFLVILVAELFIAGLIYDWKHTGTTKTKALAIWILLPLVLFSLTLVANRYVLAVLVPIELYIADRYVLLTKEKKSWFIPVLLALHIITFMAVGVYSNHYLHTRGLG